MEVVGRRHLALFVFLAFAYVGDGETHRSNQGQRKIKRKKSRTHEGGKKGDARKNKKKGERGKKGKCKKTKK
jgi:hypothetical protein